MPDVSINTCIHIYIQKPKKDNFLVVQCDDSDMTTHLIGISKKSRNFTQEWVKQILMEFPILYIQVPHIVWKPLSILKALSL